MVKLKDAIHAQALREQKYAVPYQDEPGIFHVHEAGHCALQILLKKKKVPFESDEMDARTLMLLADGHMHQAQLTGYMHRAPNLHVTNIEHDRAILVDGFVIIGHADAVVYDVKEKKRWLVEIKSLSRFNTVFKSEDEDIDALKQGYPEAIPQARLAASLFNTDGAIILCKSKDDSDLREYHLDRDDSKVKVTIDKFRKINEALKHGKELPCDFPDKKARGCRFCKYPSRCGR